MLSSKLSENAAITHSNIPIFPSDMIPDPKKPETPDGWRESMLRALFTVPMRYADYRQIKAISEINEDEKPCIWGKVKNSTVISGNKKPFLKITVEDKHHETFQVLWFNFRPYHLKQFEAGNTFIFSGKPKMMRAIWTFFNPDLLKKQDMGSITPIYRKEGAETSEKVGARVRLLLRDGRDFLMGTLPPELPEILEKLELPDLITAVRYAHWPDSLENAYLGQESLKVAEMVLYMNIIPKQSTGRVYALRPALMLNGETRQRLLNALPFSLSPSQTQAWAGIEKCLSTGRAQDMLILGGVGSGKSAIAYLAAMAQCISQKSSMNRSLLIAPTVILAKQLYENLCHIAQPLGIFVGLHGKDKYGSSAYPELQPQIWVGTYGLLNAVTDWDRVGMVIFDEEHRYGKDTKSLPPHAHRILMSATPIPQTLAQQRFGDLPIFRLKNDHHERCVHTSVLSRKNPQKALEQIHQTLIQDRKALIVYAAIQEQEKLTVPEWVFFLHPSFPGDRGILLNMRDLFPEWTPNLKVDSRRLAQHVLPYAEAALLHDELGGTPFFRLNKEFSAKKILSNENGQQNLFDQDVIIYDKTQADRIFRVPEHALRKSSSKYVTAKELLRACQNDAYDNFPLWRGTQLMQSKSLENATPIWESRYPGKVVTLHGKMEAADKETAVAQFRSGEKPILIASSIVEVGIDVQGAETIIIADADRMGVASLAQLRGRVGRHGEPGYCFFMGPEQDPDAMERLSLIASENNEERLALRDFMERGFGSLDNTSQSGHSARLFRLPRDARLFLQVAQIRATENKNPAH